MENKQELKIPKERVGVVIGKKGSTKKKIEKETNTKINITKEGEVTITGEDALDTWIAKDIVKAIGRGFSPENAMLLLEDDYVLEIIDLKEWGRTEKALYRIKSRVIGEEGKAKRTLEELTRCKISVYGKTVSIIGESSDAIAARKAIETLISGAKHATVYRILEKENKKRKIRELLDW